jgi:hypothetical protein
MELSLRYIGINMIGALKDLVFNSNNENGAQFQIYRNKYDRSIKGFGFRRLDWNKLAHDAVGWWCVVKTVKKRRIPQKYQRTQLLSKQLLC